MTAAYLWGVLTGILVTGIVTFAVFLLFASKAEEQ